MKKIDFHWIELQIKREIKNRNKSKNKNGSQFSYKTSTMCECVDIHSSIYRNSLLEAIELLQNIKAPHKRPYFDFSKTKILTPMAMIYFKQILEKYPEIVCRGRTSPHSVVSGMLSKLGIASRLGFKGAKSTHNAVERWYSFSGENTDLGDEYDEIEGVLKDKFGEDSETFDVINTAIGEAIINVVNHAYTKDERYKKWYLFLSITPDKCNVVISDLGQSIPTSIPTKITDGMLKRVFNFTSWGDIDDAEKIEIATQYQRTSTQLAYRGKGFQDMKAVCDQIDGAIMAVHSKCGYWAKQTKNGSERFKKQNYKSSINGTIISWLLPLDNSTIKVAADI